MIYSIALILIFCILINQLFDILKLPRLLGYLLVGMILGPYLLNLLNQDLLLQGTTIRSLALIIILLKAGLSLKLEDLKTAGISAVLLSFVPATFEIIAYYVFVPILFGLNHHQALLLGSMISAVSPAVVVPRMSKLIDENYGKKKAIPQMILAGASLDDVIVMVLFSVFLTLNQSDGLQLMQLASIPLSIISGIIIGAIAGFVFAKLIRFLKIKDHMSQLFLVIACGFALYSLEKMIPYYSGLLSVMMLGITYAMKTNGLDLVVLKHHLNKLWFVGEIFLFVSIGSIVNFKLIMDSSFLIIFMLFIGLMIRSIGVLISLIPSKLNNKEKLFCIFAYLPKATVQAAIGSIPYSLGIVGGEFMLVFAVTSILVCAPLGAILMDKTYQKLIDAN